MAPANGYLQIYFTQGPLASGSPNDPPIAMSVWQDCLVTVELDTSWNWEFIQGGSVAPMTLGLPQEATRYFNLVPTVGPNNRCTKIQFGAQYYAGGPKGNLDPFNLYVLLDQPAATGSFALQVPVKIDPEVENPGDPPSN